MQDNLHKPQELKKLSIKYALRLLRTCLQIVAVGLFTGVYFGRLFFGEHGTEVYSDLRAKIEHLKEDIANLNKINARLQKEYFELKSIQGN